MSSYHQKQWYVRCDFYQSPIIIVLGSLQGLDAVPEKVKNLFKLAHELDQRTLINMSAERGRFICQSQKLCVYLSRSDIKKLVCLSSLSSSDITFNISCIYRAISILKRGYWVSKQVARRWYVSTKMRDPESIRNDFLLTLSFFFFFLTFTAAHTPDKIHDFHRSMYLVIGDKIEAVLLPLY